MKSEDINVLVEVFCSVLERESFMFGYAIDKEEGTPADCMQLAKLTFSGEEVSGAISIILPEDLALEVAANILGAESDEDFVKEQAHDALGELLNVLCGQFLTTVEGEVPVFDLGVPVVNEIGGSEWKEMLQFDNTALLMVEDEFSVLLQLKIN